MNHISENLMIRLTLALYAKSTPFVEREQIWALIEYLESW